MTRTAICLVVSQLPLLLFGQQVVNLEENKAHAYNGLEYSYYISNETSKEVKGEDYERYELNLTVTNNSGCLKIMPFKTGGTGSTDYEDDIMIAEFNCTNGTGKRLTAKKGNVSARPWFTNVRIPDDSVKDKFKTVYAQVGYAVHNGQAVSNRIIVIVPKGERPKVNCRIIYLPEVQ